MDKNPVIIVTGASRGIGEAIAHWLGRAKANVVLMARSIEALHRVAENVQAEGGDAHPFVADVSDPAQCRACVEEAIARYKRLDGLVHNAGMLDPLQTVIDTDVDIWRRNFEVNLFGPLYLNKAALPHLRRQKGRIISVSSGAAHHPIYAGSAYCASKAALNQLNSVLAKEEPAITCVAVRPGVVDTAMQANIRKIGPGVMPPEEVGYYLSLKEKNALEPPDVPAQSIAWLALAAPRSFSGRFMNYDDAQIAVPAKTFFGKWLQQRA